MIKIIIFVCIFLGLMTGLVVIGASKVCPSEEMLTLYGENETFKEYVNRYATSREITVEETLTHKLVVEYGESLRDGNDNTDSVGGDLGAADGETD